ncbi:MAG: hypothetical protein M0R17_02290 [Candidatus Omnitrophica bacterium]|jgi:hypothetical protein|nr:hypothetical protein [Candidatus Omnitrophota bacterium]
MDILARIPCDHRAGEPLVGYVLDTCPKCLGSGYIGEFQIDNSGNLVTIYNQDSLSQQVIKILKENKRSTGYGFDYSLMRGVIDTTTTLVVYREIVRCISYLSTLQQEEKAKGNKISSNEEIKSIISLEVTQNIYEPRQLDIVLNLRTAGSQNPEIVTTLTR